MGERARAIGRTGAGLAACAAALAGLLGTTTAAQEEAPREVCAPGGAAADARIDGRIGGRASEGGAISDAQAAEYERRLRQERVPQQARDERRTVPVVVHVVSAEDGTGDLSEATVRRQVDVLNRAFGGGYGGADTGFRFELRDITRTADDGAFASVGRRGSAERAGLRRGGPETLNLYTADLGHGILGRSTFPQDYADDPGADGVVVDHRTVPGGGRENFDLGHTATHETGHWLGLFHTFQNGCSSPGDYVADTAYEREQATGCPTGRDTCPDRSGTDPVDNFMNYSDDACMERFTGGQADRMADHWYAFRAGKGA
ncbi:zinc metalloprotease [Nocardiopsis sp. RSe5-2]|uniref:Zinc metalloprotease n=1 Tax=Nocardiopsis endophytica TaxID=3018445 RepID=A0ABT4U1Q3_9ACTN|nr:zinc metalloprotease [Nocardiopsis endophytica]MDA2810410.1 zinc metalloprotease [Nocardiopsis endophytica]